MIGSGLVEIGNILPIQIIVKNFNDLKLAIVSLETDVDEQEKSGFYVDRADGGSRYNFDRRKYWLSQL